MKMLKCYYYSQFYYLYLAKLFDQQLNNFHSIFTTSDMQFGFKQKHSTTQCSFVINEAIQYYQNNNSPVYCTMLDASKAFDRVNYIRLFTLLRNKGLCPLYCRFLIMLYTNQQLFVKWNNTFSSKMLFYLQYCSICTYMCYF